jgi:hypothetical protein
MNIFTIIGGVLIISANLYFIAFSDSNCAIALNMVSAGLLHTVSSSSTIPSQ